MLTRYLHARTLCHFSMPLLPLIRHAAAIDADLFFAISRLFTCHAA